MHAARGESRLDDADRQLAPQGMPPQKPHTPTGHDDLQPDKFSVRLFYGTGGKVKSPPRNTFRVLSKAHIKTNKKLPTCSKIFHRKMCPLFGVYEIKIFANNEPMIRSGWRGKGAVGAERASQRGKKSSKI